MTIISHPGEEGPTATCALSGPSAALLLLEPGNKDGRPMTFPPSHHLGLLAASTAGIRFKLVLKLSGVRDLNSFLEATGEYQETIALYSGAIAGPEHWASPHVWLVLHEQPPYDTLEVLFYDTLQLAEAKYLEQVLASDWDGDCGHPHGVGEPCERWSESLFARCIGEEDVDARDEVPRNEHCVYSSVSEPTCVCGELLRGPDGMGLKPTFGEHLEMVVGDDGQRGSED